MRARQSGSAADDASKAAGRYMDEEKHIAAL